MLYSLENESFAVLECEKEALSDLPRETCNDINVPTETSETFDGEQCAEVNGPYDLAYRKKFVSKKSHQKWRNKDIIMG